MEEKSVSLPSNQPTNSKKKPYLLTVVVGFVLGLVLLAAVVFLSIYLNPTKTSDKASIKSSTSSGNKIKTSSGKIHIDKVNKFEFNYPQNYIIAVNSDLILLRGNTTAESDWEFKVDLADYSEDSEASFKDYAINQIKDYCAAGGPTGDVECTEITKETSFRNEQGAEGIELFIKRISTERELETGKLIKTEEQIHGPIYAFDVSAHTNKNLSGIFFAPTQLTEKSKDKNNLTLILDKIVSTFKFLD